MKKLTLLALAAFLLASCGQEAQEAVQTDASATPGITVEKPLGRRVINAGYTTLTMTVYRNLEEEDPDLDQLPIDEQTVLTFNYDALRTSQKHYENQDDTLTLTLSEKYLYEDETLYEVDTLDENGEAATVSTLADGVWTDTDSDGNALSTSSQRDEYGNIIVLYDEDGNQLQRTYDANGFLLSEKKLDSEGTEISTTTWTRYTNDILADEIVTVTADGTEDLILNRGSRNGDTVISYYTDLKGSKYSQITDTYEDTNLVRSVEENLEDNTYTITLYTYA
jgi:hypothetical protein